MKVSKKILFIIFFIIFILTNLVFAGTGKVSTQATRVRQEANTTSTILTVIYENDEVEILETSGDWYKIKYKEYTGYVKKEFIETESSRTSSNTTNANSTNTNATNSATTNSNETVANSNNTVSNQAGSDEVANTQTTITINSETYAKLLPNFSSTDVVKFEVSTQVNKINEINNWIQVSDGVNTGWILKNKLQEIPSQEVTNENTNTTENNQTNTTNTISNTTTNTVANTVANTTANSTTNNTSSSTNKIAKITVETAKVRQEASTTSNVLGFLDYGDEVPVLEQDGDWYKINFENKTGYIKNTLCKISDGTVSSRSLTEERKENEKIEVEEVSNVETNASEVVNYAKQFLGYPYIVGGKNPNTGFDCSGFTRYVFLNFGYSLASTAAAQTSVGAEISRENLQPGDLVLFLNEEKSGIGHTGIYLGSGEFIHSANPERGVVTDNLNTNSYYNERFVSGRRIVNN